MTSSPRIREPFNALSHLAGAILLGLGSIVLVISAISDPMAALAFAIFGLGAVFMFTSSSLYHWLKLDYQWLQRMDHCAIYVMIAGSYTPIALLALPSPTQLIVLAIQWGLAVIGVVVAATREKTPTPLRLTLYLVMGWMIVALIPQLRMGMPVSGIAWMVAGGVSYTVGAVVYASKKPTLWPGKFGFHELWHVFVLGGAICHFVVMVILCSTIR